MKKYITSILILCLLLQFVGCYSSKYISTFEIEQYYPGKTINIKLKDKKEYILKEDISIKDIEKNPDKVFCSEWISKAEELALITNKVIFSNERDENGITIKKIEKDTIVIQNSDLDKISIDQFNNDSTWLLIGSLIVIALIGLIYYSIANLDLGTF